MNKIEVEVLNPEVITNCEKMMVCAARLTRIRPLAGIPIIEQKFMSRLQVNLFYFFNLENEGQD